MTEINLNDLEIPRPSSMAALALEIVSSTEPAMGELEQAIMHDPLLASSLLRYANSPLYRRSSEITNVPTALKLLGLKNIRSALVTASIRSMMPVENAVGDALLRHMTDIAVIARLIGHQCFASVENDLEFLGLVHDVGMLTLAANFERAYDKILQQSRQHGIAVDDLERKEFGFSHDVVTGRTAQVFRLPKRHVDVIVRFHSSPELQGIDSENDRDSCVLALAHCLRYTLDERSDVVPPSVAFIEAIPGQMEDLAALLEINSQQLDALCDAAAEVVQGRY